MNKLVLSLIAALGTVSLPARAASACDTAVGATLKVLQVAAHLYITEAAGVNGGKTRNVEEIYLNGVTFVMVNGQWRKSPVSTKEMMDQKKDSAQKLGDCSAVRDEIVNGEPATLYKIHNKTPEETIDAQLWVSKLRGLPLKEINDVDVGGGAQGKSHTEIRYEYTNVTAPAVTK